MITLSNVHRIERVAELGWGYALRCYWLKDGHHFVVETRSKALLYDVESLNAPQQILARMDGGEIITALSSDNRLLAVSLYKTDFPEGHLRIFAQIQIIDFASGAVLQIIEGRQSNFQSLYFSPSNQYLVGIAPREAWVWEVASGNLLSKLAYCPKLSAFDPVTSAFYYAAYSDLEPHACNDPARLNKLQRWDAVTHQEETLPFEIGSPYGAAFYFGEQNAYFAHSNSQNNRIELIDLRTGECWQISELNTGHFAVRQLLFSPDGKQLALLRVNKTVTIYDVMQQHELATFEHDTRWFDTMQYTPDGRLFCGISEGEIAIWDTQDWRLVKRMQGNFYSLRYSISPDSQQIVVWGGEVWSLSLNQPDHPTTLSGFGDTSSANIKSSASGQYLLAGHSYGSTAIVRLWDVARQTYEEYRLDKPSYIGPLAISPDERYIAAGSWYNTVTVWDRHNGQRTTVLEGMYNPADFDGIAGLTFSSDGGLLAMVDAFEQIRLWRVGTWEEIARWENPNASRPLFSPDGEYLVVRNYHFKHGDDSDDRPTTLTIWNVRTRQREHLIEFNSSTIPRMAFHPTGRLVVGIETENVAGGKSSIEFVSIDMASGYAIPLHSETFEKTPNLSLSIAIDPSGALLAYGVRDTIIFWDIVNRQKIYTLPHSQRPDSILFTTDGRYLVTTGIDRTISIWAVPD